MMQANDLWVAAAGRVTMEDIEGWLMPWLAAHDAEISEAASQTIEDLTVKLVRTSIKLVHTRVELDAARATIRAERVAPDHQAVTLTIHQALAPWHMSIATAMGSQEHYNELLATIADALIASGVLGNTYRNPYQAETLQGLRESGNGEMHDLGSFAEPATEPWTDPAPYLNAKTGDRYAWGDAWRSGAIPVLARRTRSQYDAEEGNR